MTTKRSNGEGSINRYKNGWRGSITVGRDIAGKLIRKQFYGKTKKEVIEKVDTYKVDSKMGLIPTNKDITLEEWIDIYINEFKINEVKAVTLENIKRRLTYHILKKPISKKKLNNITPLELQILFNSLEGLKISSIKDIYVKLKSCLKHAVKVGYLIKNPMDSVVLIKNKDVISEVPIFTVDEQRLLIDESKNNKHYTLIITALGTGLRIGELLGLKWDDIDFDSSELHVKRVLSYCLDPKTNNYCFVEQSPKTRTSSRTLPIPNEIVRILRLHHKNHFKKKLEHMGDYNIDNYVFCNSLGKPASSANIRVDFSKLLLKLNLPNRKFHSLRHTYATRLFEASVPLKTVSILLGHSDIQTTANIYTHVLPNEKISAVDKLNVLFS